MTRPRAGLAIALMMAALLLGTTRWTTCAQEVSRPAREGPTVAGPRPESLPVQLALLRPYPLPFANDTSLDDVVTHLRQTLKAPVVLDLAALKRKELTPAATVRLQLDGVRLQTGLKLLLD